MNRIGLLVGGFLSVTASGLAQTPPPVAEGKPRWTLRWERPAFGLQQMSLSGDGRGIAFLDNAHVVRRLNPETGATLWTTERLDRVDRIVASSGGQALVWKAHSPIDREILVLTADSGTVGARRQKVSGAIWSVAVTPSASGFFVGTGDRFVTRFPLGSTDAPSVRLGVTGIPESIAVAEQNSVSACGLWLGSGVAGLTGTAQWRIQEPDSSRWFDLQLSADGSTLLGISQKGSRRLGREARVTVWDAPTGHLLWSKPLPGASAQARVNGNGTVIAISYSLSAHYSTGDLMESKLAPLRSHRARARPAARRLLSLPNSRRALRERESGDGARRRPLALHSGQSRTNDRPVAARIRKRLRLDSANPVDVRRKRASDVPRKRRSSVLSSHRGMNALFAEIDGFIRSEDASEGEFDRLALALFAYQYARNLPYQRLCDARGITSDTVHHWREIPAAPASAFKRFSLSCAAVDDCTPDRRGRVFHSSGTTGADTSRHFLDSEALAIYETSLRTGFPARRTRSSQPLRSDASRTARALFLALVHASRPGW